MSTLMSFRVPEDLARWLDRSAAARGVRRSDVIRMALDIYMDRVEAGWVDPNLPPAPWGHKVTFVAYVEGQVDDDDVLRAVAAIEQKVDAEFVGVSVAVEREAPRDQVAS